MNISVRTINYILCLGVTSVLIDYFKKWNLLFFSLKGCRRVRSCSDRKKNFPRIISFPDFKLPSHPKYFKWCVGTVVYLKSSGGNWGYWTVWWSHQHLTERCWCKESLVLANLLMPSECPACRKEGGTCWGSSALRWGNWYNSASCEHHASLFIQFR